MAGRNRVADQVYISGIYFPIWAVLHEIVLLAGSHFVPRMQGLGELNLFLDQRNGLYFAFKSYDPFVTSHLPR